MTDFYTNFLAPGTFETNAEVALWNDSIAVPFRDTTQFHSGFSSMSFNLFGSAGTGVGRFGVVGDVAGMPVRYQGWLFGTAGQQMAFRVDEYNLASVMIFNGQTNITLAAGWNQVIYDFVPQAATYKFFPKVISNASVSGQFWVDDVSLAFNQILIPAGPGWPMERKHFQGVTYVLPPPAMTGGWFSKGPL